MTRHKLSLKAHIMSLHENVKYLCVKCDYKATHQSSLKAHKLSIHEGVKYLCTKLTQNFQQNLAWRPIERVYIRFKISKGNN